ncbi:uroporphyrinogen decarboxylase family protein [Fontivita pretiosa]|uniref:uroporphyrinogen decarboxylase family protein n=1 Tax=Fontivita pretiosa TaxID=2989684 RepID=UPI003D164126
MPTPKQLVESAMRQQHPEQVPVMCQMANGHTIINTAVHPIDYFISNEVWADCLIRMRQLYDFDGILCHKPGRVPGLMDLVERVDRDAEVPTLYMRDGARIECTRDDDAYYKKSPTFRFPTLDEIDYEHPLDWAPQSYRAFQWSKGTFDFKTPEQIPQEAFGLIDRVIERCGDRYSVHGEVRSPLDHFLNLLGMEEGLIALLTEPEKSQRLLETCTKWSVALAVAQVRRGAHAIKISSPFAGSGFLSPQMYEQYIIPAESRIAEAVRQQGAFSYTHTCGAIGDRLELMMRCGVSGIECLDPPPLGNVDLADAVRRCNGRIFIKGNIDPVNTLLRGNRQKVEHDVREILETAGHTLGGFILSTACSIAPPTPPDNIKRAVELCRRFKP